MPGLTERPINVFLPRLLQVTELFPLSELHREVLSWFSTLTYFLLQAVFPVTTCLPTKAFLGFCKSIHYVDARGVSMFLFIYSCIYLYLLFPLSSVPMELIQPLLNAYYLKFHLLVGVIYVHG